MIFGYSSCITDDEKPSIAKKLRGPVREELVLLESRVLRAGQTPACTQCAVGVLGAATPLLMGRGFNKAKASIYH